MFSSINTKANTKRHNNNQRIKINRTTNEYNYKLLEDKLKKIIDIERLQRKLSLKMLQPCDFCNMDISYNNILKIFEMDVFSNNLNFLLLT